MHSLPFVFQTVAFFKNQKKQVGLLGGQNALKLIEEVKEKYPRSKEIKNYAIDERTQAVSSFYGELIGALNGPLGERQIRYANLGQTEALRNYDLFKKNPGISFPVGIVLFDQDSSKYSPKNSHDLWLQKNANSIRGTLRNLQKYVIDELPIFINFTDIGLRKDNENFYFTVNRDVKPISLNGFENRFNFSTIINGVPTPDANGKRVFNLEETGSLAFMTLGPNYKMPNPEELHLTSSPQISPESQQRLIVTAGALQRI